MYRKHFFIFFVYVIFLITLTGCKKEEELWTFELTEDGNAYNIIAYLGEEKIVEIPETYQDKPVIGLLDTVNFTYGVQEIYLSKNLETFYEEKDSYLRLKVFDIPEDANLKSISEHIHFEFSAFHQFYIPKDLIFNSNILIGVYDLNTFSIHSDNPYYEVIDGVLYDETKKELIHMPISYLAQSFEIPEGVEKIRDKAFFLQKTVDLLYIPSSVIEIGDYVFAFSEFQSITFHEETKIKDLGFMALKETKALKHFNVPDSVTVLKSTFSYSDIKTVSFGENSKLEIIWENTFEGTRYLKSLVLPMNLVKIYGAPFSSSGLEHITFLSDLIEFEDRIFSQMDHIKEIIFLVEQSNLSYEQGVMTRDQGKRIIYFLPENDLMKTFYVNEYVESIGVELLREHAYRIESFDVHPNNPYLVSIDGVIYSKDLKTLLYYPSASKSLTYSVRYGTEVIHPFISNLNLKTLYIPETVKEITRFGFAHTKIEQVIFLGDSKIETIPENAFYRSQLKEIVIPKSVKTIEASAFQDSNLEKLTFEEGSMVVTIGYHAFRDTKLESVILPNHQIEIKYKAFFMDTLKYVYIQHKYTKIEENAFFLHKDLTFYLKDDFDLEDMKIFSSQAKIEINVTMSQFLNVLNDTSS